MSPRKCKRDDASRSSAGLLEKIEEFVKDYMAGNDSSHDFAHVLRVRRMAMAIAADEVEKRSTDDKPIDLELVEMAALLHDVGDYKYAKPGDDESESPIISFLRKVGVADARARQVDELVNNVGFKKELANRGAKLTIETAIVQDADRLEAIGAIGIARTFTFGGARGRPMYEPEMDEPLRKRHRTATEDEYVKNSATKRSTVSHFYDKLLFLSGMMKTDLGKKLAETRHKAMESFLEQFYHEWEGHLN
eukprot:GDKH01004924.1.p1 GENE.GDKH01004924.1~~GDKH01004924.1.p1  ORF type:complete len:249 (+),score=35.04 GDKH01004924.1:111-857(+)